LAHGGYPVGDPQAQLRRASSEYGTCLSSKTQPFFGKVRKRSFAVPPSYAARIPPWKPVFSLVLPSSSKRLPGSCGPSASPSTDRSFPAATRRLNGVLALIGRRPA